MVLVLGMVLLAVGAQGAIRVLLDQTDIGLFSLLGPVALRGVGPAEVFIVYTATAVVGVALAAWGARRARATGDLGR